MLKIGGGQRTNMWRQPVVTRNSSMREFTGCLDLYSFIQWYLRPYQASNARRIYAPFGIYGHEGLVLNAPQQIPCDCKLSSRLA